MTCRLFFSLAISLQTRKKMMSRKAMSPMLAIGTGTVRRFLRWGRFFIVTCRPRQWPPRRRCALMAASAWK